VAGPCSRRWPMMPARTRLPRALMGSSSHSLQPLELIAGRLGIAPIVPLPRESDAIRVDVLTIHSD
jgi:hypothetical protein